MNSPFVAFWQWLVAFISDRRASPSAKQLIIIAAGLLILLILFGFVIGIFDWVFMDDEEIIQPWKPPKPHSLLTRDYIPYVLNKDISIKDSTCQIEFFCFSQFLGLFKPIFILTSGGFL